MHSICVFTSKVCWKHTSEKVQIITFGPEHSELVMIGCWWRLSKHCVVGRSSIGSTASIIWHWKRARLIWVIRCSAAHFLLYTLRHLLSMKLKNLLPFAVLALNPIHEVAAESGYWDTCNSAVFGYDDIRRSCFIWANYRELSGIYNVATYIYFDLCFMNSWGHLLS